MLAMQTSDIFLMGIRLLGGFTMIEQMLSAVKHSKIEHLTKIKMETSHHL